MSSAFKKRKKTKKQDPAASAAPAPTEWLQSVKEDYIKEYTRIFLSDEKYTVPKEDVVQFAQRYQSIWELTYHPLRCLVPEDFQRAGLKNFIRMVARDTYNRLNEAKGLK